jgi:hypothetical protein
MDYSVVIGYQRFEEAWWIHFQTVEGIRMALLNISGHLPTTCHHISKDGNPNFRASEIVHKMEFVAYEEHKSILGLQLPK